MLKLDIWWNAGLADGDAKLYKVTGSPGTPVYTAITLPAGLTITGRRPCFVEFFDNYVIVTNFWHQPVVVVDDGTTVKAWTAGLAAPVGAASFNASGSGLFTGRITSAFITYAYELPSGQRLVESNPQQLFSGSLDVTNAPFNFTGLATVSPGRPNRIRGWVGIEGNLPRVVFSVPFGSATQSVSMSAATLEDQEALPNNGLDARLQARTPPPNCRYIRLYNRRIFYAMEGPPAKNYFRMYYTEIDEAEAVDPSNYFDDEGRETVTGLGEQDGNLIMFCRRAMSALRGWSSGRDGNPADMSFRRVHSSIGSVNHHSIVNINGRLYHWAEDGLRIWDGQTRLLGRKARGAEVFRANPAHFYTGIALNDSLEQCYVFLLYGPEQTKKYVYYYQPGDPDVGGSDAEMPWCFDSRNRLDTTLVSWRKDSGDIAQLSGSTDGLVYSENVAANVDDMDDDLAKRFVVVPRHDFCNVPGGGFDTEGKRFDRVWLFLNAQNGSVRVNIWAGDERAYQHAYQASRSDVQLDPLVFQPDPDDPLYQFGSIARSVWEYKPDVAGRGITVGIEIPSPPADTVWYGYSVLWRPGPSGRLAASRTLVP